jgi:hypothetical protein
MLADAGVLTVREAGQHRIISVNMALIHEIADVLPISVHATPVGNVRKKKRR